MRPTPKYEMEVYEMASGKQPFTDWISELDDKTRAIVRARIFRLQHGNLGKWRSVGEGVRELKIYFGPGVRVYFGEHEGTLIVLLCGGDKGDQTSDIRFAKKYWADWKTNHG